MGGAGLPGRQLPPRSSPRVQPRGRHGQHRAHHQWGRQRDGELPLPRLRAARRQRRLSPRPAPARVGGVVSWIATTSRRAGGGRRAGREDVAGGAPQTCLLHPCPRSSPHAMSAPPSRRDLPLPVGSRLCLSGISSPVAVAVPAAQPPIDVHLRSSAVQTPSPSPPPQPPKSARARTFAPRAARALHQQNPPG